jgi:DNA-binding NarL/FixJ family response regulator
MTEPVRVLIVDDHPVVRRGLMAMLQDEPWVATVMEAATVREALAIADSGDVDVIAMDVKLPDGDGIEATRQINARRPHIRIMVLTMDDDQTTALRALRAGARGYLVKRTDPDVVMAALQIVSKESYVFSATVGTELARLLRDTPERARPPFDRLSPRELQITYLVASGLSNSQIARKLTVSEKTVRNQLSGIFPKVGVSDRTQLAIEARKAGLCPPDGGLS